MNKDILSLEERGKRGERREREKEGRDRYGISNYLKVFSYQCLDHVHSFCSQLSQEFINVNGIFNFQSIHQRVQHDECTSTTYTSTAVD
jgi:hypothetical protein